MEYLNKELEKKDRYLEVINKFAIHLLKCQSEDDIVWAIAKNAIAAMGFEDCVVYLFDEHDKYLVQRAAHGPKNPIALDILNPILLEPGQGIVGSVALSGIGEIISDTRKDDRYVMDDEIRLSEIAVPLIHEEKVIGVIDSEHESTNFFHFDDLEILNTIASIAATRIMQMRFYEELQRHQHELEDIVAERTAKLAERNQELLDSMNYAKRIQSSILPQKSLMQKCFKDHFVLYEPKDIVSGDFYFVMAFNDLVFFAVADCTGHGVPGALLSLMGSNALHDAIHDGIKDPAELLNHIRPEIVKALNTGQYERMYDGMDICLCAFNTSTNQLHFSGGNLNLTIIRDQEVYFLKGIRQSVGYFEQYEPFHSEIWEVQPNDKFYLFSDGFKDQFGGDSGKKYKQGPFIDFIKQHSSLPFNQQELSLRNEFTTWKNEFDQIDDVCVLGIQLI